MRNLFYIVACVFISIIVGLLSPFISPELFNLVESNDSKELEYIEIVEIEPETKVETIEKPKLEEEKVSSQIQTPPPTTKKVEEDNNVEELLSEAKVETIEKPKLEEEKVSSQIQTPPSTTTKKVEDDNYEEELPPETLFRINRYGKWEFWNYYRDVSRINFSKKIRNLYEETYEIKNKKDSKFKYSIHVFASKKTTLISQLKLKGLYENFDKDENLYRYFYRSFDNYWVCRRELREVRSNGFPDAYIVKL